MARGHSGHPRLEDPHPGAQLTFTDVDGHRYQVFLTDLSDDDIAYLEGIYRARGRAECYIRDAKDTGLANLLSADFAINQAWLTVVLIAGDLLARLRGLCLEGDLAHAEPKRLRYCLLHTAGPAGPFCPAHHPAHRGGMALGPRPRGGLPAPPELGNRLNSLGHQRTMHCLPRLNRGPDVAQTGHSPKTSASQP